MRFAFVTETYPPQINGVALTVAQMVKGVASMGHPTLVVHPGTAAVHAHDGTNVCEVRVPGIPLPRYPGLRFGLPARLALGRAFSQLKPDIVYIATEGPLGWAARFAARRAGATILTGFHTRFDEFIGHYGVPFIGQLALGYLRRFHNACDATLVPTTQLQEQLAGWGFANPQLMERSVDTTLFHPDRRDAELRAQWGLGPDDLAVVYIGRIAPEKNLDLAADAYAAIVAQHPTARMICVGDGPARSGLERKYPDHVFCGMQCGMDLARHYAASDLFLFPSMTDTFGNVVLESLASSVPVVAYDYAAGRQYLQGIQGKLAAFGDSAAFIQQAMALAAQAKNGEVREAARGAVGHLEPRALVQHLVTIAVDVAGRDHHQEAA